MTNVEVSRANLEELRNCNEIMRDCKARIADLEEAEVNGIRTTSFINARGHRTFFDDKSKYLDVLRQTALDSARVSLAVATRQARPAANVLKQLEDAPEIDPATKRIMRLYYVEGISWKQVAEEMNLSIRTCYRRADAACEWLADKWEETQEEGENHVRN